MTTEINEEVADINALLKSENIIDAGTMFGVEYAITVNRQFGHRAIFARIKKDHAFYETDNDTLKEICAHIHTGDVYTTKKDGEKIRWIGIEFNKEMDKPDPDLLETETTKVEDDTKVKCHKQIRDDWYAASNAIALCHTVMEWTDKKIEKEA